MDPITAVSLFGNVVQFVEFSTRLLKGSQELYKSSAENQSAEYEQVAQVIHDLAKIIARLRSSYPASEDALSPDQVILVQLCRESQEVSDELLTVLDHVEAKGSNTKWKSMRSAIKASRSKKQIERLYERLQAIQQQLQLYLSLQSVTNNLNTSVQTSERLQNFDQETRTIIQALASGQSSSALEGAPADASHVTGNSLETGAALDTQELQDTSVAISLLENLENSIDIGTDGPEGKSGHLVQAKIRKELLALLGFPVFVDRYISIPCPHSKTFEWIFEEEPSGDWSSLPRWLRAGSGMYLIKGLAASGKSTMMKYIFDSARTEDLLKTWSGSTKLGTAAFFFWSSGTAIERSQNGLLRSLLYTIMAQEPQLLPHVFRREWIMLSRSFASPSSSTLVNQSIVPLNLFLLVDGLDEYDGKQDELIRLFQDLCSAPNVKAIVSSRPIPAIVEAFQSYPCLSLDKLNSCDIHVFIDGTLKADASFETLARSAPTAAARIIDKAEENSLGIFLWAKLIVQDILQQLNQGNNVDRIMNKIETTTSDLQHSSEAPRVEEIYDQLWEEIPENSHIGASEVLQTIHAARSIRNGPTPVGQNDEPVLLIDLVLASTDNDHVIWDQRAIQMKCEAMAERLRRELPSFIEVMRPNIEGSPAFSPGSRIQYRHRATKDYIDSIADNKLVKYTADTPFSPHLSLLKSSVQQLKLLERGKLSKPQFLQLLWDLVTSSLLYAHQFERTRDVHATYLSLLDKLDDAMVSHHLNSLQEGGEWLKTKLVLDTRVRTDDGWVAKHDAKRHWTDFHPTYLIPKEWKNTFLSLVVQFGPSKFVEHKLGQGSTALRAKKGRPLIDYAIRPMPNLDHGLVSPRVIKVLLDHGANPNEKFGKLTCWQNALLWQYEQASGGNGARTAESRSATETRLKILQILIAAGAKFQLPAKTDFARITLDTVVDKCFKSCRAEVLEEFRQVLVANTGTSRTLFRRSFLA